MDPRLRRRVPLLAAAGALAIAVAGVAYASIPGPGGVINGCRHKINGDLRVIDSAASCNSSEVPLNWNQAGAPGTPGPAGPAGPSDAYAASTDFMDVGGADTTLASVDVPAGSYTVAAKTHLYNTAEDSFAVCELRAGSTVVDDNTLRLIAPANDQVVPFLGAVVLTEPSTIALVCNGNGVESVESEDSKVVATKVGALH